MINKAFKNKFVLIGSILLALSAVIGGSAYFFLPDRIKLQIINPPGYPEASKAVYLVMGFAVVLAGFLMTFFLEDRRIKWFILECFVFVCYLFGIFANFVMP